MPYSREVRLGIVLYGGVSLAIYENGVAQELFHAVQGDGIYALLKDLIDSDIVVDIISGTSAGGVNGIYLAYALANRKNFKGMSNLWRDKGDIDRLLRRTDDPETTSLLDSRGYYQPELEAAFRDLASIQPAPNSIPSDFDELDLFVTGTDVYGHIYTTYDDQGHPIDIKNHRTVFRLSWRAGRKNDFDTANIPELATLARITSCFPVAFEPVKVDPSTHPHLTRWGLLDGERVLMDGGVLDNKPFSYTIDAIFRRTADRPVERFLFYVEPDPEQFKAPAAVEIPNVATAAMDALINIPGYQSIAEDLAAIGEHNSRVAAVNALAGELAIPQTEGDCLDTISVVPEAYTIYVAARLTVLRDRAVQGILTTGGRREQIIAPADRRAGRILVESFDHWQGYGGSPTEALRLFDVYFRLRRLFHLTYAVHACVKRIHPAEREPYRAVWRRFNHHLEALEIVEWALEWYVDHVQIEWRSLDAQCRTAEGDERPGTEEEYAAIAAEKWGQVERGLRLVLDPVAVPYPEAETPAALAGFHTNMRTRVETLARSLPGPDAPVPERSLLFESDSIVETIVRQCRSELPLGNDIAQAFCDFLQVDSVVYPLQYASGVHTRDIIRVVRLSPADAARGYSSRAVREKVCGKAMGSFGGFFKKPWRSNDIMWGRLDGACQLIECLLTKARASQVLFSDPDMETRLAALFPNTTTPAQRSRLSAQLNGLAGLSDDEFSTVLSTLVQIAQEEIVGEEWPRVVGDALAQERAWSSYRTVRGRGVQPPFDPAQLVWVDPRSTPDYLIVETASAAMAHQGSLPAFSQYKVAGRPFLEEMPRPVLLELGARAAMRLEKSLSAAAPRFARIPIIHKTLFGYVLPAAYSWSRFHRNAPEWRVASSAALLAASIAVFTVVIFLWEWDKGVWSKTSTAFLAGSLAVIATWLFIFQRSMRRTGRTLAGVAIGLCWLFVMLASVSVIWPGLIGFFRRIVGR